MACPSASPRRSARGHDVPGLRYETALAASPRRTCGEALRSSLAASPRSERSARSSATATPRASSSAAAAAAGAPAARRVPLLALDRAVRPGPDGLEGVVHSEVADTARVWKAVPSGQACHGLQVVSHSHPNIALQALTSARRHTVRDTVRDSAVVDVTQDEMQDTSRVWRSRSRTIEALTSARVHPRTPGQRRTDGGDVAAGVPSVSPETIGKLMDMLEMCTSAHNGSAAPPGGALSGSVRPRRTKSNTPMRKERHWEEAGEDRRRSMPRCDTPPQRWHTPPPAEKCGVDDSQPGNFQSQSSLETSSFITGDEYAEAEDDADAPPAAMFTARAHQERTPSAGVHKGSPGRGERQIWKTPRCGDEDEAPLSIVASSPRQSLASSPRPVNRLPPFHPAPRHKKKDSETPLTSARYETARSTVVYQLEAELAEQRETSKRAMDEKRDTEHRLNLREAKNEELEGKLKRLAEGMLKATSKISDLESRLAEKGNRDADSSSVDDSSGARTPKPALSARLAEVEAQLSGGWQRGWPSCEALEAQLLRHRELLAAEEGTAQQIAELEARLLATSLDAAVASDERRLEAQRSRCDELEESLAERCQKPAAQASARVLELEEFLEAQAREHEEALAAASEESLRRLEASEAKCRQFEERLAKQKEAAATMEAATVELFTDLQGQVAAKDRHKEAMETKLQDLEERAERAEAESRALEGRLADLQQGAERAGDEGEPRGSERLQELEATLRECRQQILELEAKDGALGAQLAEQLELVAIKDARIAELQAEADAKEERVQSSAAQVEGHLQRLREAQDERERLEQSLSRQGDEAAAAAERTAARVAELESQVGKKDAEQEEALRKAAEEGRQRLRVFETLCEELSQQLEEQRRCMASSDAENARRVASLEDELAESSQRLQTAEVEAKYSEGCLRANEMQTAQLQAELAQVREDAEVEADKAASRIAELEARLALTQAKLSGQQEALDEVLARRAAEHTQRLRTSEARGQELELRLKRLSTSPAPARCPSAEKAAQTESSGGDSDALKDAVRTACMRLGADWAQWLRRSSGRRLIVPAWRGVYLSFPKAEVAPAKESDGMPPIDDTESGMSEEEDCEEDDGAPKPPGSSFWDWPLSRGEKRERAVFVDRQMLLADQRALMDHSEVLRSSCVQHGVEVTPYLWD